MSVRLISKLPVRKGKFGHCISVLRSESPSLSMQRQCLSSLGLCNNTPTLIVPINRYSGDAPRSPQTRWMTSTPPSDSSDEPELLYEGPMNPLITALKTFSLSSAFLSAVGLPGMMMMKGLDLYTGIHIAMVGTTVAGSVASTLGLQWIFAPYIYTLESIPVPPTDEADANKATTKENEKFLLGATTRSIFLTKVVHVFDPETDVKGVPGGTIRPFCSFLAKDKPLFVHEQMIQDPELCKHLFISNAEPIQQQKNPDPDDEFL